MKKFIFICLLFLAAVSLFGQSWHLQNSNTTADLYDIWFLNDNNGFACGKNGTFIKTTDGGNTWVSKNVATTKTFTGLQFVNSTTGYMASYLDSGAVLFKTTDGGNNWTNISPSIPFGHCGGGWFFTPDTGFLAVGDQNFANSKILRTMNGGSTWDTVYSGTGWISFFHFPERNTGYASLSTNTGGSITVGSIIKTLNGGASWTSTSAVSHTPLWMSGVYFTSRDTGYCGGGDYSGHSGYMYKTTDGGNSWQNQSSTYGASRIVCTNSSTAYAIGGNFSVSTYSMGIVRTINGGTNWSMMTIPTTKGLHSIYFPSPGTGYAVGDTGTIIKYGLSTGMTEMYNLQQNDAVVFPNPFSKSFTIKMNPEMNDENLDLLIYDFLGNEVIYRPVHQNETIERGNLSEGIYFYVIRKSTITYARGKILVTN